MAGNRYHTSTSYKDFERKLREDMERAYRGMNEKATKTIEINPEARPKPRQPIGVAIEHDPREMAYVILFPRHSRLGSTVLLGPDGRPEDIGPNRLGTSQWQRPGDALAHFQKVYENFRRFF